MPIQISWQKTITTAGTAVVGPTTGPGTFQVEAIPANTGTYCYVGNDGADDVAAGTGYVLKKDGKPVILTVSDMAEVWFDSDTNGDKVMILKIGGEQMGVNPPAC